MHLDVPSLLSSLRFQSFPFCFPKILSRFLRRQFSLLGPFPKESSSLGSSEFTLCPSSLTSPPPISRSNWLSRLNYGSLLAARPLIHFFARWFAYVPMCLGIFDLPRFHHFSAIWVLYDLYSCTILHLPASLVLLLYVCPLHSPTAGDLPGEFL